MKTFNFNEKEVEILQLALEVLINTLAYPFTNPRCRFRITPYSPLTITPISDYSFEINIFIKFTFFT